MEPDRGVTTPAIELSKVVLPAPLAPSTHAMRPAFTSRSTPRRAGTGPYQVSSPRTVSNVVMVRPSCAEISGHHARVRLNRGRRANDQDGPLFHGNDRIGHRADEAHVVFHHEHRDAKAVA